MIYYNFLMRQLLFSTVCPSVRKLLLFKDICPVFKPIALANQFDDFTLVEQPIQLRRCKNLVAKHLCPLFRAFIGRNDE
jgi:hypothetical protein